MWLQGKNTERQEGLMLDKGENPVKVLVKFLGNDTRWISVHDIPRKAALSLSECPSIVLQMCLLLSQKKWLKEHASNTIKF